MVENPLNTKIKIPPFSSKMLEDFLNLYLYFHQNRHLSLLKEEENKVFFKFFQYHLNKIRNI
jgi:hypothetical protein